MADESSRNQPKSRTTLVVFLSFLLVFLVVNSLMVGPYVLAVFMGFILSLLARPLYQRLRSRRFGPQLSSSLVTLAILFLVIGPLSGFVSVAVRQGQHVVQSLVKSQDLSIESVLARVSKIRPVRTLIGNPAEVEARLRSGLENAGKSLSTSALAIAGSVPDTLLQIALALMTCFFFLIDGPKFLLWLNDKIPLDRDVRARLYAAFKDTAISTIWATLAAAAVQAAVIAIGFWALGVPGAVLAAGATFIFAWIPIVGSTPVWAAGAIYLYTQDSIGKMIGMLIVGVIAGISDNFVRPMVLRGRANMHPLVSLVAIFGGIQLFGIFGVFLGPILTAALIALLTIWPVVARRFGLIAPEATVEANILVETPAGILVEPLTRETALEEPAARKDSKPSATGPAGNA